MAFILLYVTFPNKEEAKKVSKRLLDEKLIACANFLPIESSYLWKGKIENQNEIVALFKTKKENHKAVEDKIKELHSYDVPCIMKIEASANSDYERWINDETN